MSTLLPPGLPSPTQTRPQLKTTGFAWGATLLLLAGVFLRLASLDVMSTMLNWDEAWEGADAVNLIAHPRLTPFLLSNNGREAGWAYSLIPYILALGAKPVAVRLAAAFAAIVLLALVYRLGRELMGRPGGLWSLAGLAVLYWPVHIAHRVLRFNLYLLVGAAAALLLLRAYRTNRRVTWLAGGAALGLLAYTYFSSASWIIYLGLLVAAVLLRDRRRRANAALALALAVALAAPMAAFLLTNRAALERPAQVSALSLGGLAASARAWANAWFVQGDLNSEFNLPGRPVFDAASGLLAVCGLLAAAGAVASRARRRRAALLIALGAGFAVAAWLPSFLSDAPPNFSRAVGLVIPTALLMGAGGAWMARQLQRLLRHPAAGLVPLLLVAWTGANTYHDFNQVWLRSTGLYLGFEQHINAAADFVRDHTPPGEAVYFSPFLAAHPDVLYRSADLAPRAVAAFTGGECTAVSTRPAVYVSLTDFEPGFQASLARWADLGVLHQEPGGLNGAPRWTAFSAAARPASLQPAELPVARFGDLFEVRPLLPLPAMVAAGQALSVTLGVHPLGPVPFAPSLFVHLYGNPTPYQGGPLWAQADSELCTSYPANLWRTDETIVQSFNLAISASVPPGAYTVAIGLYPFPDGARLPVTSPPGPPANYFTIHHLTVTAP